MLRTYAAPLAKIEQRFGVPAPVLVAIWGLEPASAATTARFRRSGRSRPWPGIAAVLSGFAPVDRCADDGPERRRAEILNNCKAPGRAKSVRRSDALGGPHVCHHPRWRRRCGPDSQFRRRARFDRQFPAGARLAARRRLDEGEPNFAAILEWNSAEIYAKTVALFADRLAGR